MRSSSRHVLYMHRRKSYIASTTKTQNAFTKIEARERMNFVTPFEKVHFAFYRIFFFFFFFFFLWMWKKLCRCFSVVVYWSRKMNCNVLNVQRAVVCVSFLYFVFFFLFSNNEGIIIKILKILHNEPDSRPQFFFLLKILHFKLQLFNSAWLQRVSRRSMASCIIIIRFNFGSSSSGDSIALCVDSGSFQWFRRD